MDTYIFLNTLADIRQKMNGDKYHLIRACGLIRHLFLDQSPLLSIVNKEHKVAIKFHVSNYKTKPPIKPFIHWRILDPVSVKTHHVGLNEFLKIVSLTYDNFDYTVQDIIKTTSHILGGVHSQKPSSEKDRIFLDLEKVIPFTPDIAYRSIHSICTVSLKALEPLENILKSV